MALTNAERQKAYRERRAFAGDNGERRINTWVSTSAAIALQRLSSSYGVTSREMLERLILEAQDKRIAELGEGDDLINNFLDPARSPQ